MYTRGIITLDVSYIKCYNSLLLWRTKFEYKRLASNDRCHHFRNCNDSDIVNVSFSNNDFYRIVFDGYILPIHFNLHL